MGSKMILTTMGMMHRQILASRWSMLGQGLHSKAHISDNGPQVLTSYLSIFASIF